MSAPAGGAADAGGAEEGRRRGRLRGCFGGLLRLGGWSLALVAVSIGAAWLFLRSDWAAERGLRLLEERLSEALGRPVSVGRVELGGWPPSVTAHDLVIPGPEPSDPPFARVPEVEVQLEVSGRRELRVHVRRVFVRAPEVRLELDAEGGTNLPDFRTTGGGGGRVEVTFGSLIVRDGVFVLDEQRLPFALEATALTARAESIGSAADRRFDGRLTAGEVAFTLPDARPYSGGLSARAVVEKGRVEIAALRFAAPEVTLTAGGEITWDDAGRAVDLAVEAHGRAELLNRLGYAEEPIAGPLEVAGRFDYAASREPEGGGESAAEGEWTFTADLASERLTAYGMVFTGAAAALTADSAGVTVEIDRTGYAGGTVAGTVAVPSRPEGAEEVPARVETDLRFDGLGLAPLLADRDIELDGITGSLSGRAVYRFTTDAPAAGDGRVEVAVDAVERRPGALPVAGEAELTIRDGVVATDGALITAEGQRLTASGSYDLEAGRGRFAYDLTSTDLVPLYRALPLPAEPPGEPAPWRLTGGSGTARGELALAPAGLTLTAVLDLDAVRTPALAFDRVAGSLRLTPEAVRELDLVAERDGGELRAAGTVPLGEEPGAPPPEVALDLALAFEEWPLAELAPLLPEGTRSLEGRVSGRLDLAGSVTAVEGRAELAAAPLGIAGVAGIAAERVEAAAAFDPEELRLERLEVELAAGTVTASGSLERAGGGIAATLEAPALDLAAAPFDDLVPGALVGTLVLEATAAGTLDRPDVRFALAGTGLGLAGRALGEGGAADAAVRWADGRLEATGSLLGLVRFDGGGRLDPGAGSEAIDLELALAGDDLRALAQLAAEAPLPEFAGSFTGTLEIAGAWPEETGGFDELTARLALDRLALSYEGLAVANLEPVTVRFEGGVLTLESLYLGHAGRDGAPPSGPASASAADELFVTGTADLGAEGVPLDLDFQGSFGATWLQPMLPGAELEGTLAVLGRVRGTAEAPRVNGQGEVEGGNAILPGFPHAFEEIAATVFFDPGGALIVDRLSAELAGGDVLAQGRLDLPGTPDAEAVYRLQARARGFSLRWPEGFLLRGGADLALASDDGVRQVTGVVDLERIFYLQDVTVSLTRLLTEALQRQRLEVGEADAELASTLLNVAVRGPLRVRNNIADLEGRAELVVRGTLAAPVLFGQVTIERGGTITYAETEYEVERGLLTFANPVRIDPVIDFVATTEVDGYDVTLQLAGTLDRLDASFSSDPPLADLQVLQLLATGTAPAGDAGFPGQAPEQTGGAAALLYGQAASLVTERVNVLFGFDRFRVNPGIGGAVGFAVGKRLSRDFYVTVSNDPVNDIDYVVQAEWRVSDVVSVVLTQRGEEAFAVDLRWEKRF